MGESKRIYLASRSPRRLELLRQIGVNPIVVAADVDETARHGESPEDCVARLATATAELAFATLPLARNGPVLGADTVVVVDDVILGKPHDRASGLNMLRSLAGRTHRVLTGVALTDETTRYRLSQSRVRFRSIGDDEALAYWATGEPADKAGGYGIQGLGAVFVIDLQGSYSGVMGLPLFETAELLREVGIEVLS